MSDETEIKKAETDATGTGNAGAAANPAGAASTAPAAAAKKPSKAVKEAAVKEATDGHAPEPTIVVTGPEKGRWRAGRKFTREPSSIPAGDLTDKELALLQADPELQVRIIAPPH